MNSVLIVAQIRPLWALRSESGDGIFLWLSINEFQKLHNGIYHECILHVQETTGKKEHIRQIWKILKKSVPNDPLKNENDNVLDEKYTGKN